MQTLVFPGGKILNSCTLPLQWPSPQQSSFFQNDLALVVWSPSVEPKWENKMSLDLLTHLLKWNREMRSQGLVICAELMQQALLRPWGLEQYLARKSLNFVAPIFVDCSQYGSFCGFHSIWQDKLFAVSSSCTSGQHTFHYRASNYHIKSEDLVLH